MPSLIKSAYSRIIRSKSFKLIDLALKLDEKDINKERLLNDGVYNLKWLNSWSPYFDFTSIHFGSSDQDKGHDGLLFRASYDYEKERKNIEEEGTNMIVSMEYRIKTKKDFKTFFENVSLKEINEISKYLSEKIRNLEQVSLAA